MNKAQQQTQQVAKQQASKKAPAAATKQTPAANDEIAKIAQLGYN